MDLSECYYLKSIGFRRLLFKQALRKSSDHKVGTIRNQILSNWYEISFQGFSLDQDRRQISSKDGIGSMPAKTSMEEPVSTRT